MPLFKQAVVAACIPWKDLAIVLERRRCVIRGCVPKKLLVFGCAKALTAACSQA